MQGRIYKTEKTEKDYFDMRNPDSVYVSKSFVYNEKDKNLKKFIHKVFDKKEDNTFEINSIEDVLILRSSPKGREQVKVVVLQDTHKVVSIILQKFKNDNPQPISFSFYRTEFKQLLDFLYSIKFIDIQDYDRFKLDDTSIEERNIIIDASEKELLEAFKSVKKKDRIKLLHIIKEQNLSKEDLDVLTGRRDGIELFEEKLYLNTNWNEPDWQKFFENNKWIFGYGLDYRFLGILQKEASISSADVSRKNDVFVDFLIADENFTHLIEVKRPDTPLFRKPQNRSESWSLSQEFINAVSQILTQKAEWLVKGQELNYTENGKPIKHKTVNPKTILIIGTTEQFTGENKESIIKAKTFELFRRGLRDIDILTYDELFKRAYYLVYQKPFTKVPDDDEVPF